MRREYVILYDVPRDYGHLAVEERINGNDGKLCKYIVSFRTSIYWETPYE